MRAGDIHQGCLCLFMSLTMRAGARRGPDAEEVVLVSLLDQLHIQGIVRYVFLFSQKLNMDLLVYVSFIYLSPVIIFLIVSLPHYLFS